MIDKKFLKAGSPIYDEKQSKLLNYYNHWILQIEKARCMAHHINNFHSEVFYMNLKQDMIYIKNKSEKAMNYLCLLCYEKEANDIKNKFQNYFSVLQYDLRVAQHKNKLRENHAKAANDARENNHYQIDHLLACKDEYQLSHSKRLKNETSVINDEKNIDFIFKLQNKKHNMLQSTEIFYDVISENEKTTFKKINHNNSNLNETINN